MVSFAAIWSFLVVFPLTIIGFKALLKLSNNNGAVVVSPSVLTAGAACLGLAMVIMGIVTYESPVLFYFGMWLVMIIEGKWMLNDIAASATIAGTNLDSVNRKYYCWSGLCAIPVVCALLAL
jgi:hypothetical protein